MRLLLIENGCFRSEAFRCKRISIPRPMRQLTSTAVGSEQPAESLTIHFSTSFNYASRPSLLGHSTTKRVLRDCSPTPERAAPAHGRPGAGKRRQRRVPVRGHWACAAQPCAPAAEPGGPALARLRWPSARQLGGGVHAQSDGSSRSKRRCSLVAPEGPAADPRRAPRKQPNNTVAGKGQPAVLR